MFAHQLRAAVEAAPRDRLSDLNVALWKGFAAGAVSEAETETLSVLIEARRQIHVRNAPSEPEQGSNFLGTTAQRRPQRPPIRSVAVERRRRWAAAGRMPPAIAAQFTTGEQAALAVVAVEVVKRKACTMPIAAVAALAGVSESTVKRALRHARAIGLLLIKERRLSRFRSDTNVVTLISREWLTWLELRRSGGGVQSRPATNTNRYREGESRDRQPDSGGATPYRKRAPISPGGREVGRGRREW